MNQINSGMSANVRDAITRRGLRFKGDGKTNTAMVEEIERAFYSSVPILATGASPSGDANFSFFQDKRSEHVTNIVQPGKLTTKSAVLLLGIGLVVQPADGISVISSSAATQAAWGNTIDRYVRQGYVRLDVNNDLKHEGYGLRNYPAGGGTYLDGSINATAATSLVANNGVPVVSNRHRFTSPILVTPDDDVSLSVKFSGLIALPGTDTGRIIAYLWASELKDA